MGAIIFLVFLGLLGPTPAMAADVEGTEGDSTLGPDFLLGPIVGGISLVTEAGLSEPYVSPGIGVGAGRGGRYRFSLMNTFPLSDRRDGDSFHYQPKVTGVMRIGRNSQWLASYADEAGDRSGRDGRVQVASSFIGGNGGIRVDPDTSRLDYYAGILPGPGQARGDAFYMLSYGKVVSPGKNQYAAADVTYGLPSRWWAAGSLSAHGSGKSSYYSAKNLIASPGLVWQPRGTFRTNLRYPVGATRSETTGGSAMTSYSQGPEFRLSYVSEGEPILREQFAADQLRYYQRALAPGQARVDGSFSLNDRRGDSRGQSVISSIGGDYGLSGYDSIGAFLTGSVLTFWTPPPRTSAEQEITVRHVIASAATLSFMRLSYRYEPQEYHRISNADYLFGEILRPGHRRYSAKFSHPLAGIEVENSRRGIFSLEGEERKSPLSYDIDGKVELGILPGFQASANGAFAKRYVWFGSAVQEDGFSYAGPDKYGRLALELKQQLTPNVRLTTRFIRWIYDAPVVDSSVAFLSLEALWE